jgi:hypothetical protein
LFVYLIFVSGTIVLDTTSMADVTRDKYIRMAIVLSLFAYTVGYQPGLFEKMMAKSTNNVEQAIDNGTAGHTTETTTTQTRATATVTHTEETVKPEDKPKD